MAESNDDTQRPTDEVLADGVFLGGVMLEGDRRTHTEAPSDLEKQDLPARSEFAMYRVGVQIVRAWRRDIHRGCALHPPYPRADWHELGDDKEQFRVFCELVIPRLFSLWRWRYALIHAEDIDRKVPSTEWDAFGVPCAASVEALLKPWFNGRAKLNYDQFYEFLQWHRDLVPPPTAEQEPEQDPKKRSTRRKNA